MIAEVRALKQQLKDGQAATISRFLLEGKPDRLLGALRRNVDAVLTQLWKRVALPSGLALVAVGGYGRGELFPHSDVDVLILLQTPDDRAHQQKLEQLIQLCWDIGLELGHSIRTIEECLLEARADITVQTSLLEARLLCGNHELFDFLHDRTIAAINPQTFFRAKTLEMRQRHLKYDDTPYSLEPNCKESPGGLRDLQVILWVSKAAGLGDSWRKLAQRGLITSTEARQLTQKERAFKDIRIRLHIHTGRREDRLVFDVQTAVAESLGFRGNATRRSSEYLMQRYYWAAKAVTQLNTILLQNIEAQLFPQPLMPQPINRHFNQVNSLIDMSADDIFETIPSTMLEVFLLLEQHPELKGMTARTMRALWHARLKIDTAFRHNPENRALFMQILQAPQGVTHALRRMNQTSVLGRYLPNFRRIIGQMQHDLFHAYTVDQHILMVVRNLRRFTLLEHAHEYPLCSQLIADFERPWVLYVAALFHDIAKGRGGNHSELGMADARRFCRAHQVSKDDTALIVQLVQQHLLLSQVAQKQDLSDPEVIRRFTAQVSDQRHLTALYLLTVADIRGTSPRVWNAWKGKLLEDLFRIARRVLSGENPSPDYEMNLRQQQALKTLRLYGMKDDAHQALWRELDTSYFMRHDASDIAWQTRSLQQHVNSAIPVVKCRLAPIGEGIQVTVYCRDQIDLFCRICAYFDHQNLNILDAKVHTSHHGYALDTFLLAVPFVAAGYQDVIHSIEHGLTNALQSNEPLAAPTQARLSRQSRTFPITPTVDFRPDERSQYHLLSICANDRTGLLYAIATVLTKFRINLHTAKIMTLGERAEDVFLIDGEALQQTATQVQLETALLEALHV
ncbi:MAG: [protein-PII] uridylyltransferase [Herbaspirillum sp.]